MTESLFEEIAPGLLRWTARHPDWTPEEGGPDGWQPDVACLAWAADDAFVLIDPLVPVDAREQQELWTELDAAASALDVPVDVLLTVFWHERSAGLVFERYTKTLGCRVWAHQRGVDRLGCPVTDPFGADARLPGGIEALEVERAEGVEEVVLWLERPRALVVGDVLLGTEGGIRLCPPDWLDGETNLAHARVSLARALELPIEKVLVSHGPPVLADGRAVIARALQS